jgi:hypothetical protein
MFSITPATSQPHRFRASGQQPHSKAKLQGIEMVTEMVATCVVATTGTWYSLGATVEAKHYIIVINVIVEL